MRLPALTFASFNSLNHWLFVSSRGPASGRGNCQARRVSAEPLRDRRCLHHGWDRKGLQEGKGDEERWGKDDASLALGVRVNLGGIHQQERRCSHVAFVFESTQRWLALIAAGTIKLVNTVAECHSSVVFLLKLSMISKWRLGGSLFPLLGIAFPTSVSVNNCVCHFSPLKSDPDYTLKDGDLVKM